MSHRRNFLFRFLAAVSATAFAQTAVMQKGKAVVCENESVKCPNGHETCKTIDAPLAIGNDNYQNPDCVPLRAYHLLRCDVCHVLFTRE